MKIIDDFNIVLDAEVSLGNHEGYFGLFLYARGGASGKGAKNTEYFEGLEVILKRLYAAKVKEIRAYVCSRNLSKLNLEKREILLEGDRGIKLSPDEKSLRKAICTAQTKIKTNPNSKGGNPTKRIFITGDISENLWNKVVLKSLDSPISPSDFLHENEPDQTFWEGKEVFRIHRAKERNWELVNQAKKEWAESDPLLRCQVCGFSFVEKYGELGRNFIEAHHVSPISELTQEAQFSIKDLIRVCSNCHRMLHRTKTWMSVDDLKGKLFG